MNQERPISQAIADIDEFLKSVASRDNLDLGNTLRKLSLTIERARAARELLRPTRDPAFHQLCTHYRRSLERLREALDVLESNLRDERKRVLEEHRSVVRIREWHSLWSGTQ